MTDKQEILSKVLAFNFREADVKPRFNKDMIRIEEQAPPVAGPQPQTSPQATPGVPSNLAEQGGVSAPALGSSESSAMMEQGMSAPTASPLPAVSMTDENGRPPADWFNRCTTAVGQTGSAQDPNAVCGNLYYNVMNGGKSTSENFNSFRKANPRVFAALENRGILAQLAALKSRKVAEQLVHKYAAASGVDLTAEENTEFTKWITVRARNYNKAAQILARNSKLIGITKIAGEHGGDAIAVADTHAWEQGTRDAKETAGPHDDSPARTFDIDTSGQGTSSGIIDTTAPKKPVNKPIGSSGDNQLKPRTHKDITVSDDECSDDVYGTTSGDTSDQDLIGAGTSSDDTTQDAVSDVFDDPELFLSLIRRFITERPALRGISKWDHSVDTTPSIKAPPSIPSSQLLSGTKTPPKAEEHNIVPPPTSISPQTSIPIASNDGAPLTQNQALSHKSLVATARRLQKRAK